MGRPDYPAPAMSIARFAASGRRHRRAVVACLVGAWVLGISWAHGRLTAALRPAVEGATELLEIGALPVT